MIFYSDVTESERKDQNGEPELVFSYDTYRLQATFSPNLESRVKAHFEVWLQAAKDAENVTPDLTPEQQIAELKNTVAELKNTVADLQQENESLNSVVEQLVIDSLE